MAQDKILTFRDYRAEVYQRLDYIRNIDGTYKSYLEWVSFIYALFHDGELPPDLPAIRSTSVQPYVNGGRWIWECGDCESALVVDPGEPSICVQCGTEWVDVALPANRADIETELLRQPGFRLGAPIRVWHSGMTFEELQARTVKAAELKAEGVSPVRHLSLPGQRTWATGEVLTAANLNTYQRDPDAALSGRDGRIDAENAIRVKLGTSSTTQPFLDLTQDYLGLPQAGSDPSSSQGRMHYRTDLERGRLNINGTWRSLVTGLGDLGITVSVDEPAAADWGNGDIWFVRES